MVLRVSDARGVVIADILCLSMLCLSGWQYQVCGRRIGVLVAMVGMAGILFLVSRVHFRSPKEMRFTCNIPMLCVLSEWLIIQAGDFACDVLQQRYGIKVPFNLLCLFFFMVILIRLPQLSRLHDGHSCILCRKGR